MNRRTFLGTLGSGSVANFAVGQSLVDTLATGDREWVNTFRYGDAGRYDSVNVEIYKPTHTDSVYRYWSRIGAQNVLGQATDDGYISGYQITEWNIDWTADCDGDLLAQWNDYRTKQGWTRDGSHQLIVNCGDPGPAGKAGSGDAWRTDRSCWVKTYHNEKDELPFKHTVAHEVLHNYYSSLDCETVKSLTGPHNSEHSLGTVIDRDGQNLGTPLADPDHWSAGRCSYYGESTDGATMTLSACEKQALKYSADHWNGRH
ncbi:hypothetical protein [Halorussus halophilus]|uniref:hypothetical protein n=1 Tax=Halorussus halophilus TaxID=2650975 RepID=UPI001301716F|nr:hypothetical protein [Halorussus halophilus]